MEDIDIDQTTAFLFTFLVYRQYNKLKIKKKRQKTRITGG
jgi:hypothetical protein